METSQPSALLPLDGISLDLRQVVIDSARLRLRPIRMEDAEAIFPEFTKEITRFMLPVSTGDIRDTRAFVASALEKLASGEDLQLVITDRLTGEFLGCCGIHSRTSPLEPELGIWLKKSAHGRAYGREAITALKSWADSSIKYEFFIYPVDRENTPSRRIPESLGGQIFREQLVNKADGAVLDEVVYRIPR